MKSELTPDQREILETFTKMMLRSNTDIRDGFARRVTIGEKLLRSIRAGATDFDRDEVDAMTEVRNFLGAVQTNMPGAVKADQVAVVSEVLSVISAAEKGMSN